VPTDAAEVSVVIPNWNGRDLLPDCIASLQQTRGDLNLEIVVVDDASTDGSVELLRERFPDVRVISTGSNKGFAGACNRGVASVETPYVLLLNSDARLQPGALKQLMAVARAQPDAAVVGAQLRNADGTFQNSYARFPTLWSDWMIITGIGRLLYGPTYPSCDTTNDGTPLKIDWVGGACMLIRRDAFAAIGGFDEGYFMYAEEMDLCYRLRKAGAQVWYQPAAIVIHLGGESAVNLGARREAILYRSQVRFHRLHYGRGAADLLRAMILTATAVKIAVHGVLRGASLGRRGRRVVSLRELRSELRGV